jgi:hypothetical protein
MTHHTYVAANDARIEMVEQLHTALYGATWARNESPKEVWEQLLTEVRRLRTGTLLAEDLTRIPVDPHPFVDQHWSTGSPSDSCHLATGPDRICGRRRDDQIHQERIDTRMSMRDNAQESASTAEKEPRVNHLDLDTLTLKRGAHDDPGQGMCLLEAVSYFAAEPFTDHPKCVSPVLGAFGRAWNDALDDTTRQRLRPYIPLMVGTAGDGHDQARAWLLTDWLARVCAPAFLRTAGLTNEAEALEQGAPLTDAASSDALLPALKTARKASAAAGAAAGAAAWDAAGAAAWDAAGAAAWDAAGAAAWDAAGAAARAAARDALRPTVEALQETAFDLLDRMCAVGRVAA